MENFDKYERVSFSIFHCPFSISPAYFPFAPGHFTGYTLSPMPKMKSHSGAKKRIRKTGSGKFAFKRRGRGHLLQQKNKRQKRMNRTVVANSRDLRRLEALVPSL